MSSRSRQHDIRVYVERYLDPSHRWTTRDEVALRTLLQQDENARRTYDRAIAAHRALLGLPLDHPSGHEVKRQEEAILAKLAPASEAHATPWWRSLSTLAAAGAVIVVMWIGGFPSPAPTPASSSHDLRTRGHGSSIPVVGIGVTGVTEDGREYEAIHAPLHREDYLRLDTRCTDSGLGFVILAGLQADGRRIWYYPAEPSGQSIAIACSADDGHSHTRLDEEILVGAQHVEGELTIIGIFSERPLARAAVDEALALLTPGSFAPETLEQTLSPPKAAGRVLVQWRATTVASGTKR